MKSCMALLDLAESKASVPESNNLLTSKKPMANSPKTATPGVLSQSPTTNFTNPCGRTPFHQGLNLASRLYVSRPQLY